MEDDSSMEVIKKWMKDLSDGTVGHEIEALTSRGIRVVKAHKGSVLCDFVIHKGLLDENGNWDTGAIATLVDVIASTSSFSYTSYYYVTLDFSISYYSSAKIQEEVEVEAKAVGKKDELVSVMVEKSREMEDSSSILEVMLKRIKDLADGSIGHEIGALTTRGVKVVKAHKGFILCEFIVANDLLDDNGNWHMGAIATLVDTIANVASISYNSHHHVTLDFSISYYSTAKVKEEVEVEAKVVGKKDQLKSLIVEVRKKGNKELIAMGKLWMAAAKRNTKQQTSKL